ncbi:MAG: carboxypeptidase-like regulatory domain-containing protein [Bryobacteraceae bacterium]
MRILLPLLSVAVAFGQSGAGSLSGSLLGPAHAPAPGMTVEAKNIQTGTYYKAVSSAKGEYSFSQLPAGTYQISVLSLLIHPFVRNGIEISTGQPQRLDIQIAADKTQTTLGEAGAFLALTAKRPPPPEGPAPRMPDGKPDFSGVWMMRVSDAIALIGSPPVDLQPWAEALVRERLLNQGRDIPSSRCLPSAEIINNVVPFKYIQSPSVLVGLVEDVVAARQVFLDGRAHPSDLEPTWNGHSIGKWDGDTLVIDTVGFNDRSWLFFVVPHTEMLHETQRLRRPDLGHLEVETTYDDPGTFKTPAKFKTVNVLAPDEEVHEVVCENNQYTEHVSAK